MKFIFDENNLAEYIAASKQIDFMHPAIDAKAKELLGDIPDEIGKAKAAYDFVLNEISHSHNEEGGRVTKTATEAMLYGEGNCYTKAMLFAALLRPEGFAVGFCYQRIHRPDLPKSGYFLHGMNVVFFHSLGKWVRLDVSGREGTSASFSIDEEKLPYDIRPEKDEIDFPTVFARPLRSTIDALEASKDSQDLLRYHLPTTL